jgi:hypothetical protein
MLYGACFLVMELFSACRGRRPPADCNLVNRIAGALEARLLSSSTSNAGDDFGVPGSGW